MLFYYGYDCRVALCPFVYPLGERCGAPYAHMRPRRSAQSVAPFDDIACGVVCRNAVNVGSAREAAGVGREAGYGSRPVVQKHHLFDLVADYEYPEWGGAFIGWTLYARRCWICSSQPPAGIAYKFVPFSGLISS